MTRRDAPSQKTVTTATKRPVATRVATWTVVIVCALTAGVTLFDRKDLPARLRDNAYVEKIYKERDAALAAGGALLNRRAAPEQPADANADMKQQGYPKDDRARLDNIITNGDGKK